MSKLSHVYGTRDDISCDDCGRRYGDGNNGVKLHDECPACAIWNKPSETQNLHHKSMSQPDGSNFFAIKIVSPKGVTFEQALQHIAEHWLGMKMP